MSFKKKSQKDQVAKNIIERARCNFPKHFFAAVKRAAKLTNQSKFAIAFAATTEDLSPPSFAEYLVSLYGTNPKALPYRPNSEYIMISTVNM